MEKIQSLQQVMLVKLVNYVSKNETRTVSNSIHKKKHTHTHTKETQNGLKITLNVRLGNA